MAATDLVVAGEASQYAVLRMEPADLLDVIRENVGADSLTERDLDRVRVPAGGGQVWSVPTIEGDEAMKEITGVIIHRATRRAFWPEKYSGASDPPQCSSDDGELGVGDPGGPCAECPYNEFGSDEDGNGKACKEFRQLFVLPPDSLIPIVVTGPPGSLANIKAYFLRLLRAQLSPLGVVTKIGLEKATNKGGIAYSRVVLSAGERLDSEAEGRLRQYAAALQPAFDRAARSIDKEEVANG